MWCVQQVSGYSQYGCECFALQVEWHSLQCSVALGFFPGWCAAAVASVYFVMLVPRLTGHTLNVQYCTAFLRALQSYIS